MNMTPKSFLRPNPTLFSIKPKGLKIEELLFGCKQIRHLRVLLRQLELGGMVGRRYLSNSRYQIPKAQSLAHLEGNRESESGRAKKRFMAVWF